jgi:hypothetical protein
MIDMVHLNKLSLKGKEEHIKERLRFETKEDFNCSRSS